MALASPTFALSCPMVTGIPEAFRASVKALLRESDPVTRMPLSDRRRARALIPIPPMPTRWIDSGHSMHDKTYHSSARVRDASSSTI